MQWIQHNLRYTPDPGALLMWDSFRGHFTDTVKDFLVRQNVDIAVIPGGLPAHVAAPGQVYQQSF